LGQGGAERVVANLANEMCKECEVIILTIYSDLAYTLDAQITVHSLNQEKGKAGKLKSLFTVKNTLNKIVAKLEKDKPFDLITSHLPFAHLLSKSTYFAHRCYFVVHTVYSREMSLKKAAFLVNLIYKNKRVITVSEGVKDELRDIFRVKYENAYVIPNPVDISLIQEKAKEPLKKDYEFIIGVGRLESNKRFDLLISSYNQSKAREKFKLVLLGEGSQFEKLYNLCTELGLNDNVVFAGWQQNPYKWLKNSALSVVTSEFESLGNTIIESLACGTKAISVDCDYGPREILKDDLAKFLILDQNTKSISKMIDKALNDYPQIKKDHVKRYGINVITNKYLELADNDDASHNSKR